MVTTTVVVRYPSGRGLPDHPRPTIPKWGCYKVFLDCKYRKDELPGSDKDREEKDKDTGVALFTGIKNIV